MLFVFQEDYQNSKVQVRGSSKNAGRDFQNVYKDMVKEMNILASQEDSTQQHRASKVYVIIDLFFYVYQM